MATVQRRGPTYVSVNITDPQYARNNGTYSMDWGKNVIRDRLRRPQRDLIPVWLAPIRNGATDHEGIPTWIVAAISSSRFSKL